MTARCSGIGLVAVDTNRAYHLHHLVRGARPGEWGTLLPLDDHGSWADAILDATSGGAALGLERGSADVARRAVDASHRTGRTFIDIMCEDMSR